MDDTQNISNFKAEADVNVYLESISFDTVGF